MTIVIVALIVVVSVLLILLIMAQDPKSGGFTTGFSPGQFLGVQKTTDLLEKITWGLAAALIVFSIATNFMVNKGEETDGPTSANIERAKETGGGAAPAPQQTAPQQNGAPQPGANGPAQPAGTPDGNIPPAGTPPAQTPEAAK